MRKFVLVAGIALLFTVSATAQILTGTISGSVADPSGQRIPNATVKLTSEASGAERSAATNDTGDFVFPGLEAGSYTIRVEASGFRALERKGNVLTAAARLALGTLRLEVGTLAESVTVTAQGAEVQTTSTQQTALIDTKQLSLVSVRGRDPITLLKILPGTSQGTETDLVGGSFSTVAPTFQGKGGNTIYVDGVNGGDGGGGGRFSGITTMDNIAEVNVQMASYTAEYGLKGGSQITFVTKRGGDQYHGTGYWYKRNEEFNATNYFFNLKGIHKPIYRYQTLGANVGGPVPVKIPLLNPKGHQFFFFVSVDDTQARDSSLSPTLEETGLVSDPIQRWTFPTALERAGDFSKSPVLPTDPTTGAKYPNGIIPPQLKNNFGVAIMNIFPLPNQSGSNYNFIFNEGATPKPRRQWLYRFDLQPTTKDTFSIKHQTWYTKSEGIQVAANSSPWGLVAQRYDFTTDIGNLNYTRVVSPSIVNEFMIGVFYSTESGPPANAAALASMQRPNRGLGGLGQFAAANNPLNLIPRATFGGLPNTLNAASINYDGRWPLTGADTALSISNNVTYIHRRHTFKMGALREFERFGQARAGNFGGTFAFGTDSNDPLNTGYAFANAYIGHVTSYTEELGRVPNNRYQTTWAFFVQDTWKVHPRVTLDIGVRFYKWSPPLNGGGEASEFSFERYDPTWGGHPPVLFTPTQTAQGRRALNPLTQEILPASYIGAMVPGTGYTCNARQTEQSPCLFNGIVIQRDKTYLGGKEGFTDPLPLQWDPRFGLAWDVFGDGKLAVRTSFGAYHDGTGGVLYEGGPAFRFQKEVRYTDMNSFITAAGVTNPLSVSGTWRKNYKRPVTYNYLLGIQRDIGWNTVLDVAYVGSTTHHNTQSWNFNLLPRGIRFLPASQDPTSPGKPLQDVFLRPMLGWGDVSIAGPATTGRYDSLQVQVNRRFTGGLEMAAAYTYASGTHWGWYQQFPSSMNHNRDSNQTHVLNLTFVADVPNGSRLTKAPWTKWILDNWQASAIPTFASGFPFDVGLSTTDGFDFAGGGESCGVVQTGSALLPHGERQFLRWFNTSVFQRPSGRGDLGNNCQTYKVRGPGFNNFDTSLFKNFPVREGKVIQLRWEFYNMFNHTQGKSLNTTAQFNPAGAMVNTAFGQNTTTRPERRMQASLRFTF